MFVRGGIVFSGDDLGYAGDDGYYWSSVGSNSDDADNLYFDSGHVNPLGGNYRYFGFSVRCVALGG